MSIQWKETFIVILMVITIALIVIISATESGIEILLRWVGGFWECERREWGGGQSYKSVRYFILVYFISFLFPPFESPSPNISLACWVLCCNHSRLCSLPEFLVSRKLMHTDYAARYLECRVMDNTRTQISHFKFLSSNIRFRRGIYNRNLDKFLHLLN